MDRKFLTLLLACGLVLIVWNTFPPPDFVTPSDSSSAKFHVDYQNNIFVMNGRKFEYVSGSLHYFRVPHQLWYDRLLKLRASGINVVSTYVAWNIHEPHPNMFNFDGDADLIKFITTAQELGLYVNIRPGPYICSEWDLGGLPYFTLGSPKDKIKLRSSDSRYLEHVERYFSVLLPKLKPYLFENGGPIILVQVENEYGSYKVCDDKYKDYLVRVMRQHLGFDAVLYTADGWDLHHLVCGPIHKDGVLTTLNFGPNSNHVSAYTRMRYFQKEGPLVNSEYYPGWLDHWGEPHQTKTAEHVLGEFVNMLTSNMGTIYVNFYMFFGGTNFGFYNGANMAFENKYQPDPTSYDYDAPLTECGDLTYKYYAIRDAIKTHLPSVVDKTLISKVRNSTKAQYGKVVFDKVLLFKDIKLLATAIRTSSFPLTFEEMHQDYGFVLYEPDVTLDSGATETFVELEIPKPRDRVGVYTDGRFKGTIYRNNETKVLAIPRFNRLSLLVENMGRINYGSFLQDFKGIPDGVTLNKESNMIKSWKMWSLPLNNTRKANFYSLHDHLQEPGSFLQGTFQVSGVPADTWINLDNFSKGVVFVNHKNLGRYWTSVGPQQHIYIPSVWLKKGTNTLTIFELDRFPDSSNDLFVELKNYPNVGNTEHV